MKPDSARKPEVPPAASAELPAGRQDAIAQHYPDYEGKLPGAAQRAAERWVLILGALALLLVGLGLLFSGALLLLGGLLVVVLLVVGWGDNRKGIATVGYLLGMLALVVPFVAMWSMDRRGTVEQAHRRSTIADIPRIVGALSAFEKNTGRLPTTGEGLNALVVNPGGDVADKWRGPYVNTPPLDLWGHPYVYRSPGESNAKSFDLFSAGKDGAEGTEDDIDRFTKE